MKLFIFLAFIVATMAIYESERLLDQAIDQLELELAAQGEKDIFFQNDLDEVLFVNWNCDRQSLMSQESTWSAGLNVALEKVELGGSLSNTEKKEWTYQYIDRHMSFTKIQPHSFREEHPGLNCKSLVVDIWTVKSDGEINKFLSKSGMQFGEMIRVYGTADNAEFDNTYEVCGGDKCGCVQQKCWKKCMGHSKCDTKLGNDAQTEDHFYRQSAKYRKYVDAGRKPSVLGVGFPPIFDTWPRETRDELARGLLKNQGKVLHSDDKVKCKQDRQCKPSFPCKGACLLWG